jgi:hypothetical protein
MSGEFPVTSYDQEEAYTINYIQIGSLDELAIETSGLIESSLTNEEHQQLLADLCECFSNVEDTSCLACIDGRRVLKNSDNSDYVTRYHQAGGDFAAAVTAILGGSAALPSRVEGQSSIDAVNSAGKLTNKLCGLERSSHSGGCGAANLAPRHLEAMNNPAVQNAAKAILELNSDFFEISDDIEINNIIEVVTSRAKELSNSLIEDGWDGKEYTNRATNKNARGVEILETADDPTHGHHEQSIILIRDDKGRTLDERKMNELNLPDVFIIDLQASKQISKQLASIREREGYIENLTANILFHVAVASQLCGKSMKIGQITLS